MAQEGFGEIQVPEELPSKYLDKPNIYVGATPEQLQKEAGTSSEETDSSKVNSDSEASSKVSRTDSSTPWYYIGKL